MNARDDLPFAVLRATRKLAVWPPADTNAVAQAEQRFGIVIPSDMATFYRSMNGMPWPTTPEHGWIRLWALEAWHRVSEESTLRDVLPKYEGVAEAVIIADHCDESWWYATDFGIGGNDAVRIFLVDGLRPAKLVAASFTAFVEFALADSPDIYPDEQSAG
jgi:hypothetical protein